MPLLGVQEQLRPIEIPPSGRRLRVLSLSTVFPNPREPELGTFIRSRLHAVAEWADVKVVAPVAALDYSNPRRQWLGNSSLPAARQDGALDVFHPRWLFPPFGTVLNGSCLFLRLWAPLVRLRRSYPFDLIDAHFGFPEGVAAAQLARALGCPFQVTLRGNERVFAESAGRRRSIEWALRQAARVICVSEELRQFAVLLGVDPSRTRTVPNGIDTGLFYPRNREDSRARFDLDPDVPVIVSAGRLVEAKGHHYLLEALRGLIAGGIPAQLLIAGAPCREDHFEAVLRRRIAELGLEKHVRLLGAVPPPEMPELFSLADVFCLASFAEGWPNVIHEAQACGAPVVSTRVGGAPDMITSSRLGYLVPPQDAPALEAALRESLSRPWDRESIAEWGRSRSWQQVAREVISEMRQTVAG